MRIYQHKKDCEDGNENKAGKTALATHRFEENHAFDFNGVKMLDLEKSCLRENSVKGFIYFWRTRLILGPTPTI